MKTPVTDPRVIVDAIVHCIDRTSERDAVHDPDTLHKLLQEAAAYKKLQKQGGLSDKAGTDWEWTVRELRKRERIRKNARVVETDVAVEEDKSQERKLRDLIGAEMAVGSEDEGDGLMGDEMGGGASIDMSSG
jgi:hypothetical protein